jgi:hypothetical protein
MNRIFISYRSSDGKKEAGRLCADLSRIFGSEQVFFDKQDLRGGLSWRAAIEATLGSRPVVLLMVTPDLLGKPGDQSERRLDRPDDPIRGELLTAKNHNAMVIPLLTEGMAAPTREQLPEALQFIAEPHALKLRTEDWAHDLARLVSDLEAHGLKPVHEPPPPPPQRRKWLQYTLGGGAGLLLLGWIESMNPDPDPDPLPDDPVAPEPQTGSDPQSFDDNNNNNNQPETARPAVADLSGMWWSIDSQNRRSAVQLALNGQAVQLSSEPIPVAWYPDWQAYARELLATRGVAVSHVVYRAVGQRLGNQLNLRFEVFSPEGFGPLDTGSFALQASADGREINGQLHSHSDQTSLPVRMVRGP